MTNGTGGGGAGDTRKIQLETVVDSTGVKVGTEQAKAAVRDMSATIAQEGQKAAGAVGAIGEGAQKSAQSLERSTRSMISQIQRVRAEVETAQAGGTRADYFERLAKSRGLDQAALAPYLAQLREVEKAQLAVVGSTDKTALSTKQLAFATRGLPAQFTDIWTSLASGQAPLTVLLQQGGQIKDMFGGIVPAARAVGAALLALVNPYTILAAVGGTLLYAFSQGASESRRLRSSLIETGNAAGVTATQLQAMATRMDGLGTTQGRAVEALDTFVRTGRVGADSLERFSLAAINLEKSGGPAIEKTADAFARLARDPLKATLDLNQAMNYLSVSTLEQITALEKAGKTAEAAAVAQEAYARAIEQRAPEMLRNLGYVEKAWLGIKGAAKEAWDQLLNVGRQKSVLEEVAQLQARLANPFNSGLREGTPEREAAQARLKALQDQLYVTQTIAHFDAARAEQQAAQVRATEVWNRRAEEFLTRQQRLAIELQRIENEGLAAGKSRAEIEERLAAARQKYAEKVKESTGFEQEQGKAYADFVNEFVALTQKAEAASVNLSTSQALLLKMISDPRWQQMPETWKQQTLELAYAAVAQEELNSATKEYEKLLRDVVVGIDRASVAYARETQQINERTGKLKLETAQLGLTKEAQAELVIALNEVEIQRLEALRNSDLYALASEREQRDIDERIEALRRLAEAQREAGERGALMDLRRDWERFTGQIEQSLTDAMVAGFEGGKNVFKSIGDWIINYFRTVVARGVAQAIIGAGASAISGIASASGGSGGGGGLASLLSGSGSSVLGGSFGGFGLPTLASLGGTFGSGLSLTLSGLSGTGLALEGAASMIGSAFSGGGAGSALAGAAQGLGAVAPYLAIAYGLYRVISGVGTGRMRGPGFQQWSTAGPMSDIFAGGINNPAGGSWQGGHYQAQVDAIAQAVAATARSLGGTANPNTTYGLYSAFASEGSGANTLNAVVGAQGNPLLWINQTGGRSDIAQQLGQIIPGMILAGLRDSDLPAQLKAYFSEWTDNATPTQEQLDRILQLASAAHQMAEAFKQLGGPFLQLTDLTVAARNGILDLTGGLEQFLGKTSNYLQKFYSDEERQALSLASVEKTLTGAGLDTSGLRTTADFRNLVESIDVSTAAGQRQFAALMNSADAFAFGADLLGNTGLSLAQLTANAPSNAGVDLMVTAQVTTNALLERIEAAVRESGAETVAAIENVVVAGGGSGGTEVTTVFGGGSVTGGGN